jgi:hypothetical protein
MVWCLLRFRGDSVKASCWSLVLSRQLRFLLSPLSLLWEVAFCSAHFAGVLLLPVFRVGCFCGGGALVGARVFWWRRAAASVVVAASVVLV